MHIAAPNVHTFLGHRSFRDGRRKLLCPVLWRAAGTHGTVHAACQDLVHRHWPFTFQRVWHFGSLSGPTQLPRWLRLAFKGALSSGLGMLISAVPHRAPPTTLRTYEPTTRPICPIGGALLKATEMGPQTSPVRLTCAAQAQVLSLSSKRCRSASRARPQRMVRSPNDRRLHLSPHHRPSVTMAAVGRMAASTRALRRLLRVYLSEIFLGQVPPRAPRPTSTRRASFRVASRCAAATKARTQRPSCPASA